MWWSSGKDKSAAADFLSEGDFSECGQCGFKASALFVLRPVLRIEIRFRCSASICRSEPSASIAFGRPLVLMFRMVHGLRSCRSGKRQPTAASIPATSNPE
jgi:hypothetical protein